MTLRNVTWVIGLSIFACTVLAEDDRYSKFTYAGNEYSQALNQELMTNNLSTYPLPPINTNTYKATTNRFISVNFRNAPVNQLLQFYSHISGMAVETETNLVARIDFAGERRFNSIEILQIIRRLLDDQGIALTQTSESSVQAHRAIN